MKLVCNNNIKTADSAYGIRGHSETTLTEFWAFFEPPLKLTALLDKIYDIHLVKLTFHEPPSPLAVNVVCELPLRNDIIISVST